MQPVKKTTIKQCSDPAEAAFLASYLEQNGIPVENSMDKMGAWTGRYSLLSRGPQLRVAPRDVARARALLANPPVPPEELSEEGYCPPVADWTPGEALKRCPLCGSEHIEAIYGSAFMGWLVAMFTLGAVKTSSEPMWVCRDCDWDSKRKL